MISSSANNSDTYFFVVLFRYVVPRPIRIRFVFILVRIDFGSCSRDTNGNEETHMIISICFCFLLVFFLGPEKVVEMPIRNGRIGSKKKSVSAQ